MDLDRQLTQTRLSRRSLLKSATFGAVGLTALALVGCGDDDDDDGGATPTATATATSTTPAGGGMVDLGDAVEYSFVQGWYREQDAQYYDFGMRSPNDGSAVSVAPIYAFITGMDADGNPQFVEGQHNIVDVIPGDDGYSDLWEVNLVMVPESYEADSIRSVDGVMSASFEMLKPGLFVNCPIVPAGSTLEGGESLTQGWYKDQEVFYPDFGANPPVAIPIWAFITGMDADGNPQFVEGQRNIIDSIPGIDGYSAFWRVNLVMVDDTYEANSITSAQGVMDSGLEVVTTDLVVNCPVVSPTA